MITSGMGVITKEQRVKTLYKPQTVCWLYMYDIYIPDADLTEIV